VASGSNPNHSIGQKEIPDTKGTSEWEGWGTALKPAHEPICMARKPLAEKTVAQNVLKYGTGGINIDESRVGFTEEGEAEFLNKRSGSSKSTIWQKDAERIKLQQNAIGRFPANLIHDNSEEVRACFPEANHKSGGPFKNKSLFFERNVKPAGYTDSGNASRFFKSIIYQAKASKSERGEGNIHPTVKSLKLMEYLINMVSREGQTVLDPFMGSGTTGIACKNLNRNFIGLELDEKYCEIALNRLRLRQEVFQWK